MLNLNSCILVTSPLPSEERSAFVNPAYELTEPAPSSSSNSSSSSNNGKNSTAFLVPPQQHPLTSTATKTSSTETKSQKSSGNSSKASGGSHYTDSNTNYQVIKWAPFHKETWAPIYDASGKEL